MRSPATTTCEYHAPKSSSRDVDIPKPVSFFFSFFAPVPFSGSAAPVSFGAFFGFSALAFGMRIMSHNFSFPMIALTSSFAARSFTTRMTFGTASRASGSIALASDGKSVHVTTISAKDGVSPAKYVASAKRASSVANADLSATNAALSALSSRSIAPVNIPAVIIAGSRKESRSNATQWSTVFPSHVGGYATEPFSVATFCTTYAKIASAPAIVSLSFVTITGASFASPLYLLNIAFKTW
mmetsp:Transcript_3988/g.13350  ORF Transcript_3988/g.13350 Transcript_3988/m.13350 type:complete len:241 (+) Transcript_3988:163-885(+)